MDSDALPLSSPLQLSQPAVRTPDENQGAAAPSETTGADGVARDSHIEARRRTARAVGGEPGSVSLFLSAFSQFARRLWRGL